MGITDRVRLHVPSRRAAGPCPAVAVVHLGARAMDLRDFLNDRLTKADLTKAGDLLTEGLTRRMSRAASMPCSLPTRSLAEIDFIREDVAEGLIGIEAAFGITAGDIMFDDLSLYGRYNRIIGQTGLSWWNIPGNHNLN